MITIHGQLELFESIEVARKKDVFADWGTFKDNLKSPVHRWFTYPAGFSYKAVKAGLDTYNIRRGMTIYDPFMGSGTTNLTAKTYGINSYGAEAHPFVFPIAKAKLNTQISLKEIIRILNDIEKYVSRKRRYPAADLPRILQNSFPELIHKCYQEKTLFHLMLIREAIKKHCATKVFLDFFNLGLTNVLRAVSIAHTGWPYIAPNKIKTSSIAKDALDTFIGKINGMVEDIKVVRRIIGDNKSNHKLFLGDSRDTSSTIDTGSIDFVFTSPPYLNNFDYSDRTRLEMYFFEHAKNWREISEKVRKKLMTCATTQIMRSDPIYNLSSSIKEYAPEVYDLLSHSVRKLGELRLTKGGKKSYDLMVSGYFNDMFLVLKDVFRVLKQNSYAIFVLGDSAPYGVHIPTDEYIGRLGLSVGFSNYNVSILRKRGEKWKKNPQRHAVSLRESIVTLYKA